MVLLSKSPRKKQQFKTMFPGLNLPPRPVITRWGTWMEAAIYYAEHFDEINSFLSTLDSNDARCILKAEKAIDSLNLKNDLAFIKTNFSCIPFAIKKLEAQGVLLSDAIETFKSVGENLKKIRSKPGFYNKYGQVFVRNR